MKQEARVHGMLILHRQPRFFPNAQAGEALHERELLLLIGEGVLRVCEPSYPRAYLRSFRVASRGCGEAFSILRTVILFPAP